MAAVFALIGAAAVLGWLLGQALPTRKTPPAGQASRAEAPVQSVEKSLNEQIAAARRGQSGTIHVASRPLDGSDLSLLSGLRSLQVLLLDHADNAIGDDDCRVLAKMTGLVHLRIRGGTIGDAGLAHLARLPQLRILNLPHSRATDAGLASLASLPRLAQLRLGSRQIGDGGLSELARFPALRQLHLIDVPITDAGLETLAELPRLESLYLDGSRITEAGLDRLFRTRPDLHVHINQQHHDRDPQRGHE